MVGYAFANPPYDATSLDYTAFFKNPATWR